MSSSASKVAAHLSEARQHLSNALSQTMPLLRTRKQLDEREPRTDLTSREAAKFVEGTIGALCQMADPEVVRAAVAWWAEAPDEVWERFSQDVEQTGPKKG